MKNVNIDILFNIVNCNNNFNSSLEYKKDKISMNSAIKGYKNIPYTKFIKQSLTKFHRPSTSKNVSHSPNKHKKIIKNNEFLRPIPVLYNYQMKNEKNYSNCIPIKSHDSTNNLLNSGKNNLYPKVNGKKAEQVLLKNIISLPEIREENNFIKKSISIINQSKEKETNLNNSKNQFFSNLNSQSMKKETNNIKVYVNEMNNKSGIIRNNNNRYYQDENKSEKKVNNTRIYDINKSIYKIIGEHSYDTNILLKYLENKIRNEHNPFINSYHTSMKSNNESKNNKMNSNNLFKINESRIVNDNNGIINLIITNQKPFPEKNYFSKYHQNAYESYETLSNSKISNDKNISIRNISNQKYHSNEKQNKDKESLKFPNLKSLYYLILPGNASYLVENCMRHRINWIKPFSVVSTLFNFKWQELSYGIDYYSLGSFPNIKQVVNHFENHFVITNKAKMFINLLNYCEKRNISIFKYVPFTIIFNLKDENETNKDTKRSSIDKNINNTKYENLKEMINSVEKYVMNYEEIGNYYQNENYRNYMSYIKFKERRGDFKSINYNEYKKLSKRKKKLLKKRKKRNTVSNSTKSKDTEGNKNDKISGFTLYSDYFNNLIEENNVPLYDKNKEKLYEEEIMKINNKYKSNSDGKIIIGTKTCIEIPKTHFSGKNMWIVKAINLNRGMCMKIVNSYDQLIKVINKFKEGVDYNFTKEKLDELYNENHPEVKSDISLNKSSSKKSKSFNNNKIARKNLNSADKTKTMLINKEILMKKNKIVLINKSNMNSVDKNTIVKKPLDEIQIDKQNKSKIEEEKKVNEIKEKEKIYNCNRIIIQKYIENPLLYRGRKFDMRIWVLLTQSMKVYVFKEGHLKTCSIEYNINSKDAYSHITNYSFQKYNTNFQKYEKGNEVPFFEFQNFLDECYSEKNYNIKNNLIPQIKEIIKLTMRSAKYKINKSRRNYQFEIFGYDFMMDSEFNLFLIEINTNPGLEESSPWIKLIVPRMLDDALRLTIDHLFETKYDFDLAINNAKENSVYDDMLFKYNKIVNKEDEVNKEESLEENKNNENSDRLENKIEDNILINNSSKKKKNDNKNKKYISPFPVPGYTSEENIWDFVCDLDDPDPLDESNYKDINNTNENEKGSSGHKNHFNKSSKRGRNLSSFIK